MSEYRKTTPDELYYVTMTVVDWIDLFSRKTYKDILVKNLNYCQQNEGLEIYSYVIMTNHMHMVCRRLGKDLNELLGRFKSYTSKVMLKEIEDNPDESRKEWLLNQFRYAAIKNKQFTNYHLWQYKNHPVLLYSWKVIEQKRDYIHENPVRAGIVNEAEAYIYSSACPDSPLKVLDF